MHNLASSLHNFKALHHPPIAFRLAQQVSTTPLAPQAATQALLLFHRQLVAPTASSKALTPLEVALLGASPQFPTHFLALLAQLLQHLLQHPSCLAVMLFPNALHRSDYH